MGKEHEITKEEAKQALQIRDGKVHTFINNGMLLGADHDLESVHKDIDAAFSVQRTGGTALSMAHGITIYPKEKCYQGDLLFLETTEEFNEASKKLLEDE